MEDFLRSLLATLNSIEVKEKNNLDHLLGAIIAIENTLIQLKEPTEETEDTEDG